MGNPNIEELTDGQSLDQLTKDAVNTQWFQMQQADNISSPDGLRIIVEGEGIYLKDAQGKKYIEIITAFNA